ncbi:MAG TPA: hypothetical protein VGB03_03465 [Acidimicrobiales bacterium]|jgi:hypothetical protein
MGELQSRPGGDVAPRRPGGLDRSVGDIAVAGRPVDYVASTYSFGESWSLLSPSMQQWAEERAGGAIRDPHTRAETVYWYCRVRPGEASGPGARSISATYDLVLFGRRGLVVGTGSTGNLVDAPGATAWRHTRFDLPVDESGIRSDHRVAPADAPTAGSSGPGTGTPSAVANILSEHDAATFGNLPVATQRFLLEPFLGATSPPKADIHSTTEQIGHEYVETYWTYIFNGRWVAFAHAKRTVPYRSGLTGPALWNGSPEQQALARAPWTVSAWVAPLSRPGTSVAPR